MKKWLCSMLSLTICFILSGCCLSHEWQEATCTSPKICGKCGATEGKELGHTWVEASCTEPKTCSVCGAMEGKELGHTWVEASCTEPKTCSVCGATEGKALEHTLTEANYQEAPVCQICGETVGEPLKGNYEEWGVDKYAAELDKVYDFEIPCYTDESKTTIAKVWFTNYKTFEEDELHQAKEGYEWKTVELNIVIGDDNATQYGGNWSGGWFDDCYCGIDTVIDNYFTVNYCGTEYSDCEYCLEEKQSGWEKKEQYGWTEMFTQTEYISILVPQGYDGYVWGLCDEQSNFYDLDVDLKDVAPEDYIYFRFY